MRKYPLDGSSLLACNCGELGTSPRVTHDHVGGVPPVPKAFQAKKSLTVHATPKTAVAHKPVRTGREDATVPRRAAKSAMVLRVIDKLTVAGERWN